MDLCSPRKGVFSIFSLDMIRDSQFEKQNPVLISEKFNQFERIEAFKKQFLDSFPYRCPNSAIYRSKDLGVASVMSLPSVSRLG